MVAAFDACDGAEVDVLVTAEGLPVLRHDERLADGTAVRSLPLHALRRLVGADDDDLPLVSDVLAALAGRRGLLNLELKVPGAARALASLRPLPAFVVTTSFYAAETMEAAARFPERPHGLLVSRGPPPFVPPGTACLAVNEAILAAVRAAHPESPLWAWTVNDPAALARARAARCDVVISDDPVAIAGSVSRAEAGTSLAK